MARSENISKAKSLMVGISAVALSCALFISPMAFAQDSSGASESASESASASSVSADASSKDSKSSSASSTRHSTVLSMKAKAQALADIQNSYHKIDTATELDKYTAAVEKARDYFTTDAASQAESWYPSVGTWSFNGTRVTKDNLYQALWICTDADNNILAYAKGVYVPSQDKFTEVTHMDTMYGLSSRGSSVNTERDGNNQMISSMTSMIERIKEMNGDTPAPEKQDKYETSDEDTNYNEVELALREAAESQETKDWFAEHGVYE